MAHRPDDPDPPLEPRTAEHPVLRQLQRKGREARWHMSRHTLELAIDALAPSPDEPPMRRDGPGKGRRRRRRKRLL